MAECAQALVVQRGRLLLCALCYDVAPVAERWTAGTILVSRIARLEEPKTPRYQ